MAYSRWGASRWYTYWACQDKATENRDTALFEVNCLHYFSAAELRRDIDGCIDKAAAGDEGGDVTDGDREELRQYVRMFLEEVDKAYPANR